MQIKTLEECIATYFCGDNLSWREKQIAETTKNNLNNQKQGMTVEECIATYLCGVAYDELSWREMEVARRLCEKGYLRWDNNPLQKKRQYLCTHHR